MTTRRDVIRAGAAIILAGPAGLARASLPNVATLKYGMVVFDGRFDETAGFVAEVERRSMRANDIDGNITSIYVDYLLGGSHTPLRPIAGMTSFGSLFALRMMVEGKGLRSVYEAYHLPGPDGSRCHAQFGPHAILQGCGRFADRSCDWSRTAAEIIMTWPSEALSCAPAQSSIEQSRMQSIANSTLTSWVLAPRLG